MRLRIKATGEVVEAVRMGSGAVWIPVASPLGLVCGHLVTLDDRFEVIDDVSETDGYYFGGTGDGAST
jgi:hypothetical protein